MYLLGDIKLEHLQNETELLFLLALMYSNSSWTHRVILIRIIEKLLSSDRCTRHCGKIRDVSRDDGKNKNKNARSDTVADFESSTVRKLWWHWRETEIRDK